MDLDAIDYAIGDQERMEIGNPRLKKLYDYFSEVGKNAYSDHFLLSNDVFAKSNLPLSSIDDYLEGKEVESVSFLFSVKKILLYFLKSLGWFIVFLLQRLAYGLSRQKFIFDFTKPLTLIDIFFMPKEIAKDGDLNDKYFPGLEVKLETKGISYAYVPKFFGAEFPIGYYNMFRQIKEKKQPVLSIFQLLEFYDYFEMLMFIFIYPIRVLRQIARLEGSTEDKLLQYLIWEAMDQTAVKNFSRKLYGKRISELNFTKIKCISWYENQPQDKNFYKGLRSAEGKVVIYGAQLLLWPPTLLNIHVDENEINFGLIPDRVLVNGTYYLPGESLLDFKLGPSMRYKKLFKTTVNASQKTALLVLMPFFEHEIDEMLEMISDAKLSGEIFVKFHPATNKSKFTQKAEERMQVMDDDIYTLFDHVGCVIGKSTGALVEATSLGIPVINIEFNNRLGHEYLPKFGKGIIWQNAKNSAEILKWVNVFRNLLNTKKDLVNAVAKKHKEMFFCEPTDEMIDKAFELKEHAN